MKNNQTLAFFGMAAEIQLSLNGEMYEGAVSFLCYDPSWQEKTLDEQCGELISMEVLFPDDAIEIVEDSNIVLGFVDFGEEYNEDEWEQLVANFVNFCVERNFKYKIGFVPIDDLVNEEYYANFDNDKVLQESI